MCAASRLSALRKTRSTASWEPSSIYLPRAMPSYENQTRTTLSERTTNMPTNSTDVQEYSTAKHPPDFKLPSPFWLKVRAYYGLIPPYNFRVAIPFLLNLGVLAVVFCVSLFLFFSKSLSFGTA